MASYTWKITDPEKVQQIKSAEVDEFFTSPVFSLFNFRWTLRLYPNHNNGQAGWYLNLSHLPAKLKSITCIRKYLLLESNTKNKKTVTITAENMNAAGWKKKALMTQDIQQYDQFTFKVDVELISVTDKDDNDVTYKYLQREESKMDHVVPSQAHQLITAKVDSIITQIEQINLKMDQMQKKINDLELRVNEEQKHNDDDRINKLVEEMKLMKKNVNKLSLNVTISPEKQKLKLWLEENVKLPQYYELFINNGIDELSVVALLDKDTLKDMGIDVIGHQIKILNKAKQLTQNNNNNEEGPTAYL